MNINIKKITLLFTSLLLIICFGSCDDIDDKKLGNIEEITNIRAEEIFSQPEDEYYLFLYNKTCSGCTKIKPYLYEYIKDTSSIRFYGINFTYQDNLIIVGDKNGQGQGLDNSFLVDGCTSYDDLVIYRVPAIIKIIKEEEIKTSYYVSGGEKECLNFFNSLGE